MNESIQAIKSAKKKKFLFGEKNLYEPGEKLIESDLSSIEKEHDFVFPELIREFLLDLGCGTVNDLYIHHVNMIYPFDSNNGKIQGYVTFASDTSGNYFAFNPHGSDQEVIYYCSHDPSGYGICANNMNKFLKDFISAWDKVMNLDRFDLV